MVNGNPMLAPSPSALLLSTAPAKPVGRSGGRADWQDAAGFAALLAGQPPQAPRVVERRHRIVDGARAHDDDEPVVLAAQDPRELLAAPAHGQRGRLAQGKLFEQDRRREQGPDALHAEVSGPERHGAHSKPDA